MLMMILARISSLLLSPIINACTNILVYACQGVLILSLIFAVAFYFGWIHRAIWHVVEYELSKAALNNGACRLTVGSFEYDLIRGRVWASNLIIHSPNRPAWKWASPVIARVGKVYVETNLVWVLFSMWFLWEEPPLEVYTLHVSDIQCFVERKHQVFNVHLLDPRNVIPDPSTLMDEESSTTSTAMRDSMNSVDSATAAAAVDRAVAMEESMEQTLQDSSITTGNSSIHHHHQQDHQAPPADVTAAPATTADHDVVTMLMENDHHQHDNNNTEQQDDNNDKEDEQTAQRLVNDMLLAVESLGQAVQKHGSLPRALNEQRHQIAQRLKKVVMGNQDDSNNNNHNSNNISNNIDASKAMKQGVKIVQHVGKAVVEKTQSVQKVVLPPRRAPRKNQKIVYARFGRVVMDDVRVFTRNYKRTSKLLLSQQQQHQQRIQQQQQQQQATTSSNGDGTSISTTMTAAPSSPGVSIGTTNTTNEAHNTSPTTTPIPSHENQSTAATPTTMKDSLSSSSATAASAAAASSLQYSSVTSAWNKPIVVKRCAIRASEFCPPLNAKEGDDGISTSPYNSSSSNAENFAGFPVLYQPMDKCMDAILKRVVAEMAKANNGRIFQTALGEVLDYWSTLESKDNTSNDLRNNSAAAEQTTF